MTFSPASRSEDLKLQHSFRFYTKLLENVRFRSRKILQFAQTIIGVTENAAEYVISSSRSIPLLMDNLALSRHALVEFQLDNGPPPQQKLQKIEYLVFASADIGPHMISQYLCWYGREHAETLNLDASQIPSVMSQNDFNASINHAPNFNASNASMNFSVNDPFVHATSSSRGYLVVIAVDGLSDTLENLAFQWKGTTVRVPVSMPSTFNANLKLNHLLLISNNVLTLQRDRHSFSTSVGVGSEKSDSIHLHRTSPTAPVPPSTTTTCLPQPLNLVDQSADENVECANGGDIHSNFSIDLDESVPGLECRLPSELGALSPHAFVCPRPDTADTLILSQSTTADPLHAAVHCSKIQNASEDELDLHCLKVYYRQRSPFHAIHIAMIRTRRVTVKLSEAILASIPLIRSRTVSLHCVDLIENAFAFASDFGYRTAKLLRPRCGGAFRSSFIRKLINFSIDWVSFTCSDCSPLDSRTFRWAFMALEFVNVSTSGENILELSELEFRLLKSKVACCMTLLISQFDILYQQEPHNTHLSSLHDTTTTSDAGTILSLRLYYYYLRSCYTLPLHGCCYL